MAHHFSLLGVAGICASNTVQPFVLCDQHCNCYIDAHYLPATFDPFGVRYPMNCLMSDTTDTSRAKMEMTMAVQERSLLSLDSFLCFCSSSRAARPSKVISSEVRSPILSLFCEASRILKYPMTRKWFTASDNEDGDVFNIGANWLSDNAGCVEYILSK